VRKQLNELRLEMGNQLGLRNKDQFHSFMGAGFSRYWNGMKKQAVTQRYCTIRSHRLKREDIPMLDTDPKSVVWP